MDYQASEQIARALLIGNSVFLASLALVAWRMPRRMRWWAAAIALAVAAYAQCTHLAADTPSGGPQIAGLLVLYFLCSALPAIFWAFVQVLFEDASGRDRLNLVMVLLVGLTGVFASELMPLGASVTDSLSVIRRLLAAGLAIHALWLLARGTATDLVAERLHTRRWLLWIAGLYILAVLVIEVFVPAEAVSSDLLTLNLAAIATLIWIIAISMSRWDLSAPPPPRPYADQPQAPHAAAVSPNGSAPVGVPRMDTAIDPHADLVRQLESTMTEQRLYREEGLTIAILAQKLGTPEHRLRHAINKRMGYRNYNEFLHDYRLAEAANRLRDPNQQGVPVLTIALEAGYGSIGPFNRAFKNRFGQTPTQFRHRAQ